MSLRLALPQPEGVEVAGISVDFRQQRVFCAGRLLPVTAVTYSPATPERPGSDRVATLETAAITQLIYKTPKRIAAAIERPIPATAESCYFNVVCENGWWVEVSLWPEDDAIQFIDSRQPWTDASETDDPLDLIRFLDEVAARPQFVPTGDEIATYRDNPWCGLKPGEWDAP